MNTGESIFDFDILHHFVVPRLRNINTFFSNIELDLKKLHFNNNCQISRDQIMIHYNPEKNVNLIVSVGKLLIYVCSFQM